MQNNYKVVFYNGQLDILVNSPGTTRWINTMNWTEINLWQQKTKDIWQINHVTVGTFKNFNQFTQVLQLFF